MNKSEALVQLARLGLAGKQEDVAQYVQRLRRNKDMSDIKSQLDMLLSAENNGHYRAVRKTNHDPLPVDLDSRMQLIRPGHHIDDHDPIWNKNIEVPLGQIISERKKHNQLIRHGLTPAKSVLFVGPPGVGKTLGARWLANKLDLPLLVLDLSAVMSSYLGRTGSNIRMVLDYAKGMQCVLLLDEIDAIAKRRDDSGDVGELKRLVNVLLQEIDEWPSSSVLVAATNHPDLLDPALWRRFDLVVEFELPDIKGIQLAFKSFFKETYKKLSPDAIALLTTVTLGKSYSDIEKMCNRLRKEAILTQQDITTLVLEYVGSHISRLDKDDRPAVIESMRAFGYSDRKINTITGMSRDTIRKYSGGR